MVEVGIGIMMVDVWCWLVNGTMEVGVGIGTVRELVLVFVN